MSASRRKPTSVASRLESCADNQTARVRPRIRQMSGGPTRSLMPRSPVSRRSSRLRRLETDKIAASVQHQADAWPQDIPADLRVAGGEQAVEFSLLVGRADDHRS